MVMDMFYSYVETEKKKRVHFHGFMLDVHKSKWNWSEEWCQSCYSCVYLLLTATWGRLGGIQYMHECSRCVHEVVDMNKK